MNLKDFITIVIPCKNEKEVIQKTLDLLNYQTDIRGVKVIVSDISNDGITKPELEERLTNKFDYFDLYLMEGGLPARARNNGFKVVKTPYVLFMDSDIFLLDPKTIKRTVLKMYQKDLDLVTVKFRSDNGRYNYIYRLFDFLQLVSKWSTPFCLGGFMMVRTSTFNRIGGFDVSAKVAEDYLFSKQIKTNKFKIYDSVVLTHPRRFENKGLWYMTKLMIGSFLNRNNKSFFEDGQDYWK